MALLVQAPQFGQWSLKLVPVPHVVRREVPEPWEASGSERQDLPVVPSQAAATEHRAARSSRHTEEGFTADPDYPNYLSTEGKKGPLALGLSAKQCNAPSREPESPAKGFGGGGSAAIVVRYCTKL